MNKCSTCILSHVSDTLQVK